MNWVSTVPYRNWSLFRTFWRKGMLVCVDKEEMEEVSENGGERREDGGREGDREDGGRDYA